MGLVSPEKTWTVFHWLAAWGLNLGRPLRLSLRNAQVWRPRSFSTRLCLSCLLAVLWLSSPCLAFQRDQEIETLFPPSKGTTDAEVLKQYKAERDGVVLDDADFKPWGKLNEQLRVTPLFAHMGMIYQSQNDWRRYLVMRIGIENLGSEEQQFSLLDVLTLSCDGLEIKPDENGNQRRNASVWLKNRYVAINTMNFDGKLTIPAKGVASGWVIFKSIPLDARVPQLKLQWALPEQDVVSHDLRKWERQRLQLSLKTIGPRNCLGVCEIHGTMTTVNIGDLTEAADLLQEKGAQRVLITWAKQAPEPTKTVDLWMRGAIRNFRNSHNDQRFSSSPLFPQTILALGMGPAPHRTDSTSSSPAEMRPDRMTMSEKELVELIEKAETLIHDLKPEMARNEILGQLEAEELLPRCLAIRLMGTHLREEDLAWLKPLLSDENRVIQFCALIALGQMNSLEAAQAIEQYAIAHEGAFQRHALAQMAGSRQPVMIQSFWELTQQSSDAMRDNLILTAAEFPRTQWVSLIQQGTESGDQAVRCSCLRQLQQIDDDQFEPLAMKALIDEAMPHAQHVAFDLLSDTYSEEIESLLRSYVLKRLKKEKTLRSTELEFLARDKNPDDALLLAEILGGEANSNTSRISTSKLLETIQVIGDERVAVPLRKVIPQLDSRDHKDALKTLFVISPVQFEQFAVSVIANDDHELFKPLLDTLSQLPSSLALRLVVTRFSKETLPEVGSLSVLLKPLQKSYDPHIRKLLVSLRDQASPVQLKLINESLENYYSHSPAQTLMNRLNDTIENGRWEILIDQLGIVLRADPEFPQAWRMKAIANSQLMKLEEAIQDYTRVIEIDDHFEEVYKRRAMLFAATGRYDKAVEDFTSAIQLDPQNAELYASRGACLVGLNKQVEAKQDYEKSLQHIEERSDVLTSIAILEALLGKIRQGEERLLAAEERHRNEEYFHYNKACFYGRALQTFPENRTEDQQKEFLRLQQAGLNALKTSVETGFTELDWMQNDADLQAFRGLPEFQKLCHPEAPNGNIEPDSTDVPEAALEKKLLPIAAADEQPAAVLGNRPFVGLMRLLRPAPAKQLLTTIDVEVLAPPRQR